MPYKLRKVPKKDLYWVVDDKGKHYSKEGLPKERAKDQMKALYAAESDMKGKGKESDCGCGGGSNCITKANLKGGCDTCDTPKNLVAMGEHYEGAGILDFAKKLISKGSDVVKNVMRVADKGVRSDMPPKARETLRKYSNWVIMGINIRRDPIQSMLNTALNAISFGSWDRMKKVLNYDKMFHLGLELDVRFGKRTQRLLLEKNEVINLGSIKTRDDDTEIMRVDMKGKQPTLNQFIENTRNAMGDRFIPYDPFYNNCQDFILAALRANGLATEGEATFIKQPIEKLIQGIPEFAPKVAKAVTDLGGVVNNVLEGEGHLDLTTGMFHRPVKPLTGGRVAQMYGGLTEEQKAFRAARDAEQARLRAARDKLWAERPDIKQRAIEQDKLFRSPEWRAAQAELLTKENAAKKAEVEGFQARQKQVQDYNAEMKRRRESGFAPIVDALVKAGDIGVKYIAPVVGVPKVVTEAYKAFAPRGSEFYQGGGNVVTMKKKDFIKEHKKLIKLFDKITAEGKEQKGELKKMTGGGPMGSSVRHINRGMKGKMLPLAVDVATTIAENRTSPLGLISGLAEVAQSHAEANVRGGKKKQEIIFRSLEPSNRKGKKWTVNLSVDGKHRMVHFGAVQNGKPMSDYTIHKDKKRKERYIDRHREREDWTKSGILTPGFWAKHILWAKPTIQASLADVRKRFKI
jgi:hypothetical protein